MLEVFSCNQYCSNDRGVSLGKLPSRIVLPSLSGWVAGGVGLVIGDLGAGDAIADVLRLAHGDGGEVLCCG